MEEMIRLSKPKLPGKPRWVRLTDVEFLTLHNYAVTHNMSFASFAREVLIKEVVKIQKKAEIVEPVENK